MHPFIDNQVVRAAPGPSPGTTTIWPTSTPATVWRATAMVPQDYTRWPLAARENITLGRPRPQGDSAVHAAAERAGADTVRSTATRP